MFFDILKLLFNKKTLQQKDKISKKYYEQWQLEKEILDREQTIKEEKYELKNRANKKKYPFSKFLMVFLFINFTILELFTGWVTIKSFSLAYAIGTMPDFTPLITLLGAIIGETLSYGIYSAKSKAENIKNGIIYEQAMQQYQCQDNSVG